jgi:hypothetical protein
MDSNASFGGEVERNVNRDNDSLLRGELLKTPPLVVGQSAVSPGESAGQRRRVATGMRATALPKRPDDARPTAYCRTRLKARRRGVTAGAYLRFHSS